MPVGMLIKNESNYRMGNLVGVESGKNNWRMGRTTSYQNAWWLGVIQKTSF
jgi:hypothetical protein